MTRLNPWPSAPGAVMAAVAAFFASTSPNPNRLFDAALAGIGVFLVWSVAMAVRHRYPERPLWLLLGALTVAYAIQPLIYSANPALYAAARAARPAAEVLLIWVMLAFPTGRLATRYERALVAAGAAAVLVLWVPGMMLTPRFPPFGPFASCKDGCPENLLFVADLPEWSARLLQAFRWVGIAILLATSAHLVSRLRQATPLMRRSLAPVALASIARALSIAFFLATGAGVLVITLTLWGVPLAIALGLLLGRIYTARTLHRIVTGLRRRPGMRELRDVMAEALDDTSLELGTWDAARSRWVDADQRELRLPAADAPGRVARVLQDAENRPIAVLVHDRALLEEPLLVDALASSMHGAIASLQTESALAGERAHSAAVAEEERRRIERDLHDGAQQRLLALRMKLGVTGRLLENDPRRAAALIAEMGPDIDAAISELRALAHGIAPPLLAERGLATALAEAASHAAIPVATALEDVGRAEPAAERAIYFCCVEALQNAAKHAGSDATAKLTLARDGAALTFSVEDNGRTEDGARRMAEGHGIQNMRARVIALGGSLDVSADDGSGVRVFGRIPIAQD